MNRILFITLLALLPCVFTSLQAQGKLQGRVVSTDGEPIPYASVGVVSVATPYGTTTDNRGRYTLSINQSDSVTVRFSCTGFESQERRILIAAGATSQLDISLHPAAKQLDAVRAYFLSVKVKCDLLVNGNALDLRILKQRRRRSHGL